MRSVIGHVLPSPGFGGTELATVRLAHAVRPHGFESVAFCPRGTQVAEVFASEGFPVVPFDPVQPSYTHPRAYVRNSLEISRAFRHHHVDLIHFADILSAHFTSLAGMLARIPMVCQVRCRHANISRRDQSFLWPVDRFVFVSRNTWNEFGYAVPSGSGEVVYDGIAIEKAEPARIDGIPAGNKVVGMVSRVAPPKDFATLIKAAAIVVKTYPNVTFVIVGDYSGAQLLRDYYTEVRRMLAAEGMGEHFLFTGFRSDIESVIGAMDIAVLCSHSEGLPLFLLEAMAQSKPMIATDVGGTSEVISDGETGFLHRHNDPEDLAGKLLLLLKDPDEAHRIGVSGYEHVRQHFSNEQFGRNMARVYTQMIGGG